MTYESNMEQVQAPVYNYTCKSQSPIVAAEKSQTSAAPSQATSAVPSQASSAAIDPVVNRFYDTWNSTATYDDFERQEWDAARERERWERDLLIRQQTEEYKAFLAANRAKKEKHLKEEAQEREEEAKRQEEACIQVTVSASSMSCYISNELL